VKREIATLRAIAISFYALAGCVAVAVKEGRDAWRGDSCCVVSTDADIAHSANQRDADAGVCHCHVC
jgi:hypothetical protein